MKKVENFDYELNIPQVRSLEGDELFEQHELLKQQFASKTRITYNRNNIPTVEKILKDLEEVEEVVVRAGEFLTIRVRRNNRIWVNGSLIGYNASSTKDDPARPEEVWTYVEKTDDWIAPTTVRDLGTQWLRRKLETLLG